MNDQGEAATKSTSRRSANWPAPQATKAISAKLSIPGSKSLTNRELVLSALASEPSVLRYPLYSRDTELMVAGLRQLGVSIHQISSRGEYGADLLIMPPTEFRAGVTIDCGLAGTVMRFLPILAALSTGKVSFVGDKAAYGRPMSAIIEALKQLGVVVTPARTEHLPFQTEVKQKITGGTLEIDASASSQFVSALLLVAPRFETGLTIRHTGNKVPSLPHIEMTLEALKLRGVKIAPAIESGVWQIAPGPIAGRIVEIEPDLSNAAPFLAATLVVGGKLTVQNWPDKTTQVGAELIPILEKFGAKFSKVGTDLTIDGGKGLAETPFSGVELDLSHAGELAPTIVGLAALASSPSKITGIGHLRGHETDRLAALATELNSLGAEVEELEDGLAITPKKLKAKVWHSYDDHRMATTGALLGLAVPGLKVENIGTTAKTLPEFVQLWEKIIR